MSFICGLSGKVVGDRVRPVRVVVKKREVEYDPRRDANRHRHRDGSVSTTDDPGGIGWEIEKEVLAHPIAAEIYQRDPLNFKRNLAAYETEVRERNRQNQSRQNQTRKAS